MSQSLDRGLRILDEIAAGRTTLTQISESLGVHKTTVLRLLTTLQQHHFVRRVDAYHYQLGRRLFDLASFALESREIAAVARPAMRELSQETAHAVYLTTLENAHAVVVEAFAGLGRQHAPRRVGEVMPIHATAAGKVFLAGASAQERGERLADTAFEAYTERTITDPTALLREVEDVADSGFALERAEYEEFVSAVAAPVRDSRGDVVAVVALSIPGVAIEDQRITPLTAHVLATAGRISRELGWGD